MAARSKQKNFIKVATRFVNYCVNILSFLQLDAMRDTLIPEERVPAIQEAICGFIVHEVLDLAGEFYYDGVSNIDNRSKYDKIK